MKVKSLSRVRLLATPWTAAHQAPPSMRFSRQEYWSGVWKEQQDFLIGKDGVKGKMPWMVGVTEALQWRTENVEERDRGWVSLAGV